MRLLVPPLEAMALYAMRGIVPVEELAIVPWIVLTIAPVFTVGSSVPPVPTVSAIPTRSHSPRYCWRTSHHSRHPSQTR